MDSDDIESVKAGPHPKHSALYTLDRLLDALFADPPNVHRARMNAIYCRQMIEMGWKISE